MYADRTCGRWTRRDGRAAKDDTRSGRVEERYEDARETSFGRAGRRYGEGGVWSGAELSLAEADGEERAVGKTMEAEAARLAARRRRSVPWIEELNHAIWRGAAARRLQRGTQVDTGLPAASNVWVP